MGTDKHPDLDTLSRNCVVLRSDERNPKIDMQNNTRENRSIKFLKIKNLQRKTNSTISSLPLILMSFGYMNVDIKMKDVFF